jgi:hypothetical protein
MRQNVMILFASFWAVISPVMPMIYIAMLAIAIDTCFGIWRSVKKGGWKAFKSRRLSNTISKSLLYGSAIMFTYLIEKYIAGDIISNFISVELIMTKVFAFFCVMVEVKSINESYEDVTGKNVLAALRKFVTRTKQDIDELR